MKIKVSFTSPEEPFRLGFSGEELFPIGFEAGTAPAHCIPYDGSYEVVPRVTEQSLPTADRHLSKNIIIQKIPYFEVDNIQAGQTVIIGG